MVASKIQNPAVAAADFLILNIGIKEVMVASNIRNSKIGRCRGRFLDVEIW